MRKQLCPNCSAEVSLESRVKGSCGACGGPLLPQSRLEAAATRLEALHANIPVPEKPAPTLPLFIDCPMCGQSTGNLKCYEMGIVLFYLFGVSWNYADELGCPGCIRRKLLAFTLINVLTTNVLWPLVVLPHNLALLLSSFKAGHSLKVAEYLERDRTD